MTDYDFLGEAARKERENTPIREPEITLTGDDILLIETGRELGVRSLRTGEMDPSLQVMAQDHAKYQARLGQMGHHRWGDRAKSLFRLLPNCLGFREAVAYTGFQGNEAAKSIFAAWQNSREHWLMVNGCCDLWGYAMVRDPRSGLYYACGIFADRRDK